MSVSAHQTGLSYIDIDQNRVDAITIEYKKPLSDLGINDIKIRYPNHCFNLQKVAKKINNGFITTRYKLNCSPDGLQDTRIWIDGLVLKDRGVMMEYHSKRYEQKTLIRATSPTFYIHQQSHSVFRLFWEYVVLGVEHIWGGYDHLLFVLSLILLAPTLKKLLWSISGFTLAHSITLAFGILGIVEVGVSYIESMIALSIVFLARELLMQRATLTKRHLGIIAFIFGLLHGFGFATVLKTIGLPSQDIPLTLFGFNLGIEIGQILFIMVVVTLLKLLYKTTPLKEKNIDKVLAYGVGVCGSFWFIERVMAF
jgi:hydrogenase/urease accessory protein HupE